MQEETKMRAICCSAITLIILFAVGISKLVTGCNAGICSYEEFTGISTGFVVKNETCYTYSKTALRIYGNPKYPYECYNGFLLIDNMNISKTCNLLMIHDSSDYASTVENMQTYILGTQYHVYKEFNGEQCYVVTKEYAENTITGIVLLSFVAVVMIIVLLWNLRRCYGSYCVCSDKNDIKMPFAKDINTSYDI